mgnify:CR=1 FL=1
MALNLVMGVVVARSWKILFVLKFRVSESFFGWAPHSCLWVLNSTQRILTHLIDFDASVTVVTRSWNIHPNCHHLWVYTRTLFNQTLMTNTYLTDFCFSLGFCIVYQRFRYCHVWFHTDQVLACLDLQLLISLENRSYCSSYLYRCRN